MSAMSSSLPADFGRRLRPRTGRRQLGNCTVDTRSVEAGSGGDVGSEEGMSALPPSIWASGGAGDANERREALRSLRPAPPIHLKLPVVGPRLLSALARRDCVVDIEELHAQLDVSCTATYTPSRTPLTCSTDYLRAVTVVVAYRAYFFPGLGVQWVLYLHWLLGQADAPISTDQLKDIDVRARTHMCQNPWDYHDATSLTNAVQCSRPLSATTEPHRTDGQLPDSEDALPEMGGAPDVSTELEMLVDIKEEEVQNTDLTPLPARYRSPGAVMEEEILSDMAEDEVQNSDSTSSLSPDDPLDLKSVPEGVLDSEVGENEGDTTYSPAPDGALLHCYHCNSEWLGQGCLDRHVTWSHGDISMDGNKKSEQCPTDVPVSGNRHRRTHMAKQLLSYNECDNVLRSPSKRKRHEMSDTSQKRYSWEACGKTFPCTDSLKVHKSIHTGEKVNKCEQCGAEFRRLCDLTTHSESECNLKAQWCQICSRPVGRGKLKEHMRTHTGVRPVCCPVCQVRFARRDYLTRHMQTHTGERPYPCTVCISRFTRQHDLYQHMRAHTGERPYSCSVCQARFARTSVLNEHMRTHTGERPYACAVCQARFRRKDDLRRHVQRHAKK